MRGLVWRLLWVVLAVGPVVSAPAAAAPPERAHVADRILVELTPGASAAHVLGVGSRPVIDRWRSVPVPAGLSAEEAVAAVVGRPGVETASLDHLIGIDPVFSESVGATATEVDDPFYSYQWHFPAVQTEPAWAESTGSDVVVAVIDSGISRDGQDLDCHTFVHPYNAITQTKGVAAADDDNGHGTHVAGTVAQCTHNGVGVAGVAFDASLMPVKVLAADGSGSASAVARGIDWARTHGADVINLSLGFDCGTEGWPDCSSPIINDAVAAAAAENIVIVAASGNSGEGVVGHPANHPDATAVGAVDYHDRVADYSNRGSALDVVAPGGDVSQDANGDGFGDGVLQETFDTEGWGYFFIDGTSTATPHAAGAAALLRHLAPGVNRIRIVEALEDTAIDLGADGFDPSYGHGMIQIHDAVEYLLSLDSASPSWPSSASLSTSQVSGTRVKLSWPPADEAWTVDRYRIYQDGRHVKNVEGDTTTVTLGGLTPNTSYRFGVRAVDASGNQSGLLAATVTTADVTPPTWPTGASLGVVVYGETRLVLGWSAATDNTGVTGYRLRLDGSHIVDTVDRTATVSGLLPAATYHVEVLARDGDGTWSEPLAGTVGTARAFGDTNGHVFHDDIVWLSGSDITRGCNPPVNDLFCPDDAVTRGQMAAFLVRALGLGESNVDFFDDDDASVFESEIGVLAAEGITRGCNPPVNDLFCPDDPVTRGQMAAFLVRALGLGESSVDFFDDDDASVFESDIGALAAGGITRGCNPPVNDLFCPDDPVTRGQMAAFLKRALEG